MMPSKKYFALPTTGALDTPRKIRNLMRRVINHQLKGEIGTAQQSAINGSAKIALSSFDVEHSIEKFKTIEIEIQLQMDRHRKLTKSVRKEKKMRKKFEKEFGSSKRCKKDDTSIGIEQTCSPEVL